MTKRDMLLTEIRQTPELLLDEILGLAFASEAVLKKDWLRPEEDEAWLDL